MLIPTGAIDRTTADDFATDFDRNSWHRRRAGGLHQDLFKMMRNLGGSMGIA